MNKIRKKVDSVVMPTCTSLVLFSMYFQTPKYRTFFQLPSKIEKTCAGFSHYRCELEGENTLRERTGILEAFAQPNAYCRCDVASTRFLWKIFWIVGFLENREIFTSDFIRSASFHFSKIRTLKTPSRKKSPLRGGSIETFVRTKNSEN